MWFAPQDGAETAHLEKNYNKPIVGNIDTFALAILDDMLDNQIH